MAPRWSPRACRRRMSAIAAAGSPWAKSASSARRPATISPAASRASASRCFMPGESGAARAASKASGALPLPRAAQLDPPHTAARWRSPCAAAMAARTAGGVPSQASARIVEPGSPASRIRCVWARARSRCMMDVSRFPRGQVSSSTVPRRSVPIVNPGASCVPSRSESASTARVRTTPRRSSPRRPHR